MRRGSMDGEVLLMGVYWEWRCQKSFGKIMGR
jgi:hypothetical protein